MTPDEILRLPLDTALIILRGQKVLKVDKYDYTLHPDAKKLIPQKAADHIPAWRNSDTPDEFDYMPKTPAKPRKKRPASSVPARKPKDPALTNQESVYREPDYDDFPDDLLREDFADKFSDSEMVPLDKNSIMS